MKLNIKKAPVSCFIEMLDHSTIDSLHCRNATIASIAGSSSPAIALDFSHIYNSIGRSRGNDIDDIKELIDRTEEIGHVRISDRYFIDKLSGNASRVLKNSVFH
jgi:hypothetical protein